MDDPLAPFFGGESTVLFGQLDDRTGLGLGKTHFVVLFPVLAVWAVGVTRLPQAQLTLGWEIPLAGDRPERRPLPWIGLDASLDLAATELSVDGVSIGDLPLWSLGLRAGASLPRPTISCLR